MRRWALLGAAIVVEVAATLSLRASQDHSAWLVVVVAGYVGAHQAAHGVTGFPPALAYLIVAAAIAAGGFGCWMFYKNIDEVELTDNLWASSWAFTAYIVMLPAWEFLHWADAAPEPSHWAIYYATLGAGLPAYVWLKIRRR